MREKNVHNLIEEQYPQEKQQIWEKVSSEVDTVSARKPHVNVKKRRLQWVALAMALICVVTLSIVLPIALKDDGVRFSYTDEDYYIVGLGQTLKEYITSHDRKMLYVDWYDIAEDEVVTDCGRLKSNQDIIFFEEFFINGETGDILTFAITDNKTRVSRYDVFHSDGNILVVNNINVNCGLRDERNLIAMFEYNGYFYYLQLDWSRDEERLIEIIQEMLKPAQ